eukprot:10094391-Ditylum_brightwellii.AAC.1
MATTDRCTRSSYSIGAPARHNSQAGITRSTTRCEPCAGSFAEHVQETHRVPSGAECVHPRTNVPLI